MRERQGRVLVFDVLFFKHLRKITAALRGIVNFELRIVDAFDVQRLPDAGRFTCGQVVDAAAQRQVIEAFEPARILHPMSFLRNRNGESSAVDELDLHVLALAGDGISGLGAQQRAAGTSSHDQRHHDVP